MHVRRLIAGLCVALSLAVAAPAVAFADEALGDVDVSNAPRVAGADAQSEPSATEASQDGTVSIAPADADAATGGDAAAVQTSRSGDAALIDGALFAISDFSRAQKGSNRAIEGEYHGYAYLVGGQQGSFVQAIAASDYVMVYVPQQVAHARGIEVTDPTAQQALRAYLEALDAGQAAGSARLSDIPTWYFTSQLQYDVGAVRFSFDQEIGGKVYATVQGVDGSDLTDSDNPQYFKPSFADFAQLQAPGDVSIEAAPTGLAAFGEFLSTLDWSPLWVTLKTTGVAIVIIFVLGLLAAYFCLNISQKAKNVFDSIFTIPMVLPPTVCGFVLLWLCGRNTPFGEFFINIGFPLIFSWPATVIAAVVVAFPLMYRSALGAFENLDPNMLDAARTLGWSNRRIFVRLMLPLSWSSIAAGTVLAFARALGEFGATLFLAGNYLGVTRTIPIAIYFEWMNGNDGVAWFWTAIIIGFSFVVILFINLWSARTTKYRKRGGE